MGDQHNYPANMSIPLPFLLTSLSPPFLPPHRQLVRIMEKEKKKREKEEEECVCEFGFVWLQVHNDFFFFFFLFADQGLTR